MRTASAGRRRNRHSDESLFHDPTYRAGTPAAFGAAAEAAIDLLRMAHDVIGAADGVAHIVVGDDVAGTDDHGNATSLSVMQELK